MSDLEFQRLTKENYPTIWGSDAKTFESNGDYKWMAQQFEHGPVLEIGCGNGLSTRLLAQRAPLMSIDHNKKCIEAAEKLINADGASTFRASQLSPRGNLNDVTFLEGDVFNLLPWQHKAISDFEPKWVVCWLIGSYSDAVQQHLPSLPFEEAIAQYRANLEVALAKIASNLDTVQGVQFVHRLFIPWDRKDEYQNQFATFYNQNIFIGTRFAASKESVIFREWQIQNQQSGIAYRSRDSKEDSVPCLVSILGK
ncbi:MAG: hypothetical protein RLZZ537_13 [Pseudomonadota bacterium]|jgi:SAM-dependent methyltransferase